MQLDFVQFFLYISHIFYLFILLHLDFVSSFLLWTPVQREKPKFVTVQWPFVQEDALSVQKDNATGRIMRPQV